MGSVSDKEQEEGQEQNNGVDEGSPQQMSQLPLSSEPNDYALFHKSFTLFLSFILLFLDARIHFDQALALVPLAFPALPLRLPLHQQLYHFL